jgi:tRNA(Ile)-lysidine synthetase-like protein
LQVTREEILEYAALRKLTFFEDVTNSDTRLNRNLIRHKVVPELKNINPQAVRNIGRAIAMGQESAPLLRAEAEKHRKRVVENNTLDVKKFNEIESLFLKKEVLRGFLASLKQGIEPEKDIYGKNISEILNILDKPGTKFTKIGNLTLEKSYGSLRLFTTEKSISVDQAEPVKLEEGTTFFGFYFKTKDVSPISGKNNVYFSSLIPYNLSIRAPRPGDKIQTAVGTKKLQDIFTDAKVPKERRKTWPVLVYENEILWVPGLAKQKDHLKKQSRESFNIEVIDEREKF